VKLNHGAYLTADQLAAYSKAGKCRAYNRVSLPGDKDYVSTLGRCATEAADELVASGSSLPDSKGYIAD